MDSTDIRYEVVDGHTALVTIDRTERLNSFRGPTVGELIHAFEPVSLRFLKAAFNADSAQIGGQGKLAFAGLDVFGDSEEADEGHRAFVEKRSPDFARFR